MLFGFSESYSSITVDSLSVFLFQRVVYVGVIDMYVSGDSSTNHNQDVASGQYGLTDLFSHLHGIVIEDLYCKVFQSEDVVPATCLRTEDILSNQWWITSIVNSRKSRLHPCSRNLLSAAKALKSAKATHFRSIRTYHMYVRRALLMRHFLSLYQNLIYLTHIYIKAIFKHDY